VSQQPVVNCDTGCETTGLLREGVTEWRKSAGFLRASDTRCVFSMFSQAVRRFTTACETRPRDTIRSVMRRQKRYTNAYSQLRRAVVAFAIVSAVFTLSACNSGPVNPKVPAGAKSSGGRHAVIETDKGPIEIEFFTEEQPKAVENFRLLAEHGYYDGLTFHRILEGFMIQGGDPAGNGTGGESAWGAPFADEIDANSPLYRGGYRRGLVAMANSGQNTNGSQFFIMHADYPLPPNYVIFARVTSGLDVVDALASVPTTMGDDGARSRPVTPVKITKVTVRP
jgi:cyclophilin family peptidyl-prolyl cis-trans isomerase